MPLSIRYGKPHISVAELVGRLLDLDVTMSTVGVEARQLVLKSGSSEEACSSNTSSQGADALRA